MVESIGTMVESVSAGSQASRQGPQCLVFLALSEEKLRRQYYDFSWNGKHIHQNNCFKDEIGKLFLKNNRTGKLDKIKTFL
jgi:hypothetical protein